MIRYEKEIREILKNCIPLVESIGEIDINDDLTTIGMDSLTFISIVGNIEEIFEMEFPDDKLIMEESSTIYKLCNIVQAYTTK